MNGEQRIEVADANGATPARLATRKPAERESKDRKAAE